MWRSILISSDHVETCLCIGWISTINMINLPVVSSGISSTRSNRRVVGVSTRRWCRENIVTKFSKTDWNLYRWYYQCAFAAAKKVNATLIVHCFHLHQNKWINAFVVCVLWKNHWMLSFFCLNIKFIAQPKKCLCTKRRKWNLLNINKTQ